MVEKSTERLRLFVSIPIPGAIRHELARAQSELRELAPRGTVRWTPPEQFHLTLKFIGNVAAERLDSLKDAVAAACLAARPLPLLARGIGFFPNSRSPRVMWAGMADETGGLAGLQGQIEAAARQFEEKPEEAREFSFGHSTLGRFKKYRRHELKDFIRRAEAMAGLSFGNWEAGKIELVKSELSEEGARHATLATFALH
jgi:RNA 2',3'-cyclic 3'-phosphodiesterase